MQVVPLNNNLDRWLRGPWLGAQLAGALGLFALILATVGMAGVFAYAVQQRTREVGIRMALGATPAQVVRLVLGGSSRAVVIGVVAGFAMALPASRLLRNVLYGLSPLDPIAYISVALILAIAGLAASYAPARRATRVDPVTALRHE
jgi:ABC-type antimicrobial peptide transport system permease subunit